MNLNNMFDFDFDMDLEFNLDLEHFQADTQALAPSAMPQNQKHKSYLFKIGINLAIIVFLLGFIFLYTWVFGALNCVGAISIATSMLMFIHKDLGIQTKQAPIVIIGMFLFAGFSSHLGMISPYLGIFVNFISIFLIVTFACQDITAKVYLPFVVCYIFNQGNTTNLTPKDFTLRMVGLLAGSVLVSIVYLIFHWKKPHSRNIFAIFKETHLTSQRTRFALRLATALTTGMFIGDIFQLPRTAWIGMTINSLILPFIEDTKARFPHRILAQLSGGAIFYLVFVLLLPPQWHILGIFFTSFFYMFFHNYHLQQIFVSLNAMVGALGIKDTIPHLQNLSNWENGLYVITRRVEFVLIGAAIVAAVNLIAIYGKPIDRGRRLKEKLRVGRAVRHNGSIPPHAQQ